MMCEGQFIVIGGEVEAVDAKCHRFRDVKKLDYVGGFETREEAVAVWRGKAQGTVDNAHMRYFVVSVDSFFGISDK